MESYDWIQQYTDWLKKQYKVNALDSSDEIITPFYNSIGDNITIYVSTLSNNKIRLTDDFDTIGDLEMMGIDLKIPTRKKYIDNILSDYNIELKNGELFIEGSQQNFPILKQSLIQAIIHIDDLFITKRDTNISIFKEEAIKYFNDNDFGGFSTYKTPGASGNEYKIDYAIPKKGNNPNKFINLSNSSSFASIATTGALYGDIANSTDYNYNNSEFYIVYNDELGKPNTKSKNIIEQYNVELIPWNNKNKINQIKQKA